MELFSLEPGLAIWTWISFGLLFFILWKFVFPGLLGSIKEREKKIAGAVDKAEEIENRLVEIEKEHKEIIAGARSEADGILRKTREESEVLRKKLLKKAEDEAQTMLAEARMKIAAERTAAIESIRSELADFVCDTSEKIIGTGFVEEKERDWARELVESL